MTRKVVIRMSGITAKLAIRASVWKRMAVFGVSAFLLAGCGVGSLMGGGSDNSTLLADTSPTSAEISRTERAALPVIATECPPIKVRLGGEALFSYRPGKVGNPRALNYQAVIDGQSRNCVVSNGLINVKMGIVGRLVLGPVDNSASVKLPLRFAVERDGVAVFSQLYDLPVSVSPPQRSAEFVKIVDNVAIPYLGGENIVIWVGFDPRS